MKPARRDASRATECTQLSTLFAAAGWTQADHNFELRPFVVWHDSFFSVSGTPPEGEPISTACRTPEEVRAFLTAYKSKEVPPKPADIIEAARNARPDLFSNTDSPQTVSDPMGEALERQREANARWVQGDGPEEAPQWVPEPEAPAALEVEAETASAIPKDIAVLMQPGETLIEARRRLTEILNIELAELVLARGTNKENLEREAEIQRLRNLLARIGES